MKKLLFILLLLFTLKSYSQTICDSVVVNGSNWQIAASVGTPGASIFMVDSGKSGGLGNEGIGMVSDGLSITSLFGPLDCTKYNLCIITVKCMIYSVESFLLFHKIKCI